MLIIILNYMIELKTNYNDNKYIFNLSYGNNSDALSKKKHNKIKNNVI